MSINMTLNDISPQMHRRMKGDQFGGATGGRGSPPSRGKRGSSLVPGSSISDVWLLGHLFVQMSASVFELLSLMCLSGTGYILGKCQGDQLLGHQTYTDGRYLQHF